MRRLLIAGILCTSAATGLAQQEVRKVGGLQGRVIDLVMRIESFGGGGEAAIAGAVQDMEVKETATEVTIDLAADVLFEFDKADILPKAADTLKKAADVIRERAKGVVRVEGHTDSKGDDAYNMRLSQRRADSVRDWFVRNAGLSNIRFQTQGFGETQPVAPNEKTDGSDDPEGRQKNRRVQIVMQKG